MYFPCRGGVRGGADQFNWEDIKSNKFRENYLGHSVKAPVGRWQKGKDLAWYSKGKLDGQAAKESMLALKVSEEEAMLAALGHKPVKRDTGQLSKEEIADVLKRGQSERSGWSIERVEGMGYSGARSFRSEKDNLAFHTPQSQDADPNLHLESDEKSDHWIENQHAKDKSNVDKTSEGKEKHSKKKSKKHKRKKSKRLDSSSSASETERDRSRDSKKRKHKSKISRSISKKSRTNAEEKINHRKRSRN